MTLVEIVKQLGYKNEIRGETVYCPSCNLSLASAEQKVASTNGKRGEQEGIVLRHPECHRHFRHEQRYQGDPVARQQASQQIH